MIGLADADVDLIRNLGSVIDEDSIRGILVSTRLLGSKEIMIINHTGCGMTHVQRRGVCRELTHGDRSRSDRAVSVLSFTDVEENTREQMQKARSHPWISPTCRSGDSSSTSRPDVCSEVFVDDAKSTAQRRAEPALSTSRAAARISSGQRSRVGWTDRVAGTARAPEFGDGLRAQGRRHDRHETLGGRIDQVARQPVGWYLALKLHSDSMGSMPDSRFSAQRSTRVKVPSPRSPSSTERNAAKLRLSPLAPRWRGAQWSSTARSRSSRWGVRPGRGA